MDGAAFTTNNEFAGLNPGVYSFRSKRAGDVCIADAVSVTIVPGIGRPAPPTGSDLQACETTNPVQTLMAVATPPDGSTLKWYDAPTGGNLVLSPTLNSIGTIVYYAESSNGTCTSATRTPIRLTITELPVINAIADKNICGSFTLPAISGANLSGNQAYYTDINGGGTKYNVGDVFSTAGVTTLYAYDQATVSLPGTSCPAELSFKVVIRNTTAGAISADQTICTNAVPAALISATNGTGAGSLKYRWERSTTSDLTGFSIIVGATLPAYSPAALTTTTWYRRITLSSDEGVECESDPTAAVKITVQDAVTAGTITASQTICFGAIPAPLTGVTPATGSGVISYRWESSTTSSTIGFTTLLNEVSADYSPTALTATTWFRRVALSIDGVTVCESVPTVAVKITVQDVVTSGAIGTGQTICNNSMSGLNSVTAGTGSGTISYRWESSTTSATIGFAPINGATQADYSSGALTVTTYFRRITLSTLDGVTCESAPTAVAISTVQDLTTAGVIGTDQTVCANTPATPLSSITPGTGSGALSYRWEQSSASAPVFTVIAGQTIATYSPGVLPETTWFRRVTISSLNGVLCESEPTALIRITVQEATTEGAIAGSQTICNGTIPEPLTTTAGAGSGTISYRWESSTTSAISGFAAIDGANQMGYSPGALTTTTWFRRVTISTENGVACESAPTAVITITVQQTTTAGTISADQTICNNSVPNVLTTLTAGTGSGSITYRWESSTTSGTVGFTAIAGTDQMGYNPGALTETTWFRRVTISTLNGRICESVPTLPVKITVEGLALPGSVSGDQTICINESPTLLTSVTPGTGSGTISYRWESATDNSTDFAVIPGATSVDYSPGKLTQTTYFRRITLSEGNGTICESLPSETINVFVNSAPSGADGNHSTVENTPVNGAIEGNDVDNDELSYAKNTEPSNGTAIVNTDGSYTYTPNLDYSGNDSFTITISDGRCAVTIATVHIVISPAVSPVPGAQFSKTALNEVGGAGDLIHYDLIIRNTGNTPLKNLIITDAGADAGSISPSVIASLMPGAQVSVTATHTLTQAEANSGSFSNQATLTADQDSGIPIPPLKSDNPNTPEPGDATIVKIPQSGSIAIIKTAVLGNDDQTIVYTFNIKNTGDVTLSNIQLTDAKLRLNGKVISVPDGLLPGASVSYSETYTLTQVDKDAGEVRNTALVNALDPKGVIVNDVSGTTAANNTPTVTTLPKPPVATDDTAVTKVNTPVIINALGNDNSGNTTFDKSTVSLISQPKNGTVTVNTDGTITYTPNPGYTGNDSFTYQVRDVKGYLTNVANVSITSRFLDITVPNLFTPNGDGINDAFEIIGLNQFERSDLVIVNRWGNEVYRSGNYQNNWSGEGLNEGTYYYLLMVKRAGSQEGKTYKGYVTLIRAFKQ